MPRIPFTVSARAARLIGRENVATSQGAITELVKNAYDADASVCAILFVPSDDQVPKEISERRFDDLSSVFPSAEIFYPKSENGRRLQGSLSVADQTQLSAAFRQIPQLWIVDNGHGMAAKTIEDQWMVIGTDTKEFDGISEGGRIMTGAKGIGRFALDRLGQECELFSAEASSPTLAHWIVDWGDFEGRGKVITDVEAVLEEEARTLGSIYNEQKLNHILPDSILIPGNSTPNPVFFDRGTAIRISLLHDRWDQRDSIKLKDTLEALLPPRDQGDFNIFIYDFRAESDSGFIDNFPPDQFDYRLRAQVRADGNVSIQLDRQEIDASKISPTVFTLPAMQISGFRQTDFASGSYRYETSLRSVLKLPEKDNIEEFLEIGPFDFTLYFFKLSNPTKDTLTRFPQKKFDATKRRRWLRTSGGIRLYRDEFRVRPYGEPNSQGSDWLLLGQRVASNPAPASRMGWRVPPQQLAGTIHITKERNPLLSDQSNREGIMNDRAFAAFRLIILGLIGEFERDRAYIYGQLDKAYDLDHPEEIDVNEGLELAGKILGSENIAQTTGDGRSSAGGDHGFALAAGVKVAKALESVQRKNESLKDDIQVLRGMATLGTVLVSFTHELKQIKANMESRHQRMENALRRVVDEERLAALPDPVNPYNIVARWAREDEKVSRWVDFALSAVSPAKRRRRSIELTGYFNGLADYWREFLESKTSVMHIDCAPKSATVLAHEIDLDSIFYNLIVNSVEAFTRPSEHQSREIWLSISSEVDGLVTILYRDSGPGLSPNLKVGDDIFSFGVSSKPNDEAGQPSGTGIGMWLVQTIIQDYGGSVELRCDIGQPGFALDMTLPVYRSSGFAT